MRLNSERSAEEESFYFMTYTDRVAVLFRRNRFRWIPAERLMKTGGMCSWRTRVSEARRFYQLPIVNRVVVKPNGVRVSEYRLGRRKAA